MKISFVLPPPMFKIAGGYKTVYQYANYCVKNNIEVTIFYDSRKGDNSVFCPRRLMYFFRKIIANREPSWIELDKRIQKIVLWDEKELGKYKTDILILTGIDIAKKYFTIYQDKMKIIHFIQDHENWFLDDDVVGQIYGLPCYKIVVSSWVADIVSKYAKCGLSVVKNGINLKTLLCKKTWSNRKKYTISMMYSSSSRKNPELAINVIRELKAQIPELEVTMFSAEKRTKKIPEWVTYHYLVDENVISKIYNNSQIYLCTSNFEGFGLPGLEAMACGCVLISTDCVGVKEYAKDGYDALICPIGNKNKLKEAILKIFSDDEIGRVLSNHAIETAKKFDLQKQQKLFLKQIGYHIEN